MNKQKQYFMTNKEWYRYNNEKHRIEMTDKAPADAVEAYEDFMKRRHREGKDGEL